MKCDVIDKVNKKPCHVPMDMHPSNPLQQQTFNKAESRYAYVVCTPVITHGNVFDEFLHVGYLLLNKVIHEEHVIFLCTKSI